MTMCQDLIRGEGDFVPNFVACFKNYEFKKSLRVVQDHSCEHGFKYMYIYNRAVRSDRIQKQHANVISDSSKVTYVGLINIVFAIDQSNLYLSHLLVAAGGECL